MAKATVPDDPKTPPRAAQVGSTAAGRNVLCVWWLAATVLLLAANSLNEPARVLAPPADSVLTPESAWSVPLSGTGVGQSIAEWPFWLFATIGAGLISMVCTKLTATQPSWAVALLLTGLSLGMQPLHLMTAAVILGMSATVRIQLELQRPKRALVVLSGWWLLAVLVSLEFGFVILCGILMFLPGIWESAGRRSQQRHILGFALAGAALLAVACFGNSGFCAALLRPISWLWIRPDIQLLPSMAFALADTELRTSHALLATYLVYRWVAAIRSGGPQFQLLAILVLSLLGLGCGRFLWICTLAIAAGLPLTSAAPSRAWVHRLAVAGSVVLSIVSAGPVLSEWYAFVVTGVSPVRQVDLLQWDTEGAVLLMNLDQSPDWQTSASRTKYRLLVDDRWDVFGDLYPTYAAVCRDLSEVRSDSYLRTDGQWGGYKRWTDVWSPTLLIVDTTDVARIRRLALSPDFSVTGIDARRTVFANRTVSANRPQMLHAMSTVMNLEWPRAVSAGVDANVMVAHNARDRRRLASVLLAMRLPYAALRVLPDDDDESTEALRTWSYLELAHRVRRHSGTSSLLDQHRAVSRLRRARNEGRWSTSELLRIAYALRGLGQDHEARLYTDTLGTARPATQDPTGPDSAELLLRRALEGGDSEACEQLLPLLEEPVRDYYAALSSADRRCAADSYSSLQSVLDTPEFPNQLRGEANFYLGCLAIEVGDPDGAQRALAESARFEPASAFHAIREMYLRQLSGN